MCLRLFQANQRKYQMQYLGVTQLNIGKEIHLGWFNEQQNTPGLTNALLVIPVRLLVNANI